MSEDHFFRAVLSVMLHADWAEAQQRAGNRNLDCQEEDADSSLGSGRPEEVHHLSAWTPDATDWQGEIFAHPL